MVIVIFHLTFAATSVSDRQREILNTYLDGYEEKLTDKNWAKLAGVSLDTAGRDLRGSNYITAIYKATQNVEERISDTDR